MRAPWLAHKRRKFWDRRRVMKGYAGICAGEAARLGLKPGDRVKAYGADYVFSRVAEVVDGGMPVLLGYRLKKNGGTYADATRLERWERV